MPAAMESSQNIGNPLESSVFSSNFFIFFFFGNLGNSPGISRICSEISPAGLGISRPGSRSLGPAEILRISQPRKIGFRRCPYRQNFFLVGCKLSKSLIPDVLEFLPDFNSPQPNGNFECRGSPDSSDWLIGSHIGRTPNPRVPEPGGNQ